MRKYFKHKIKSLLIINKIVSIHHLQPQTENIKQEQEKHNFWELVYASNGCVTCTSDDEVIELETGHILFHEPNEIHSLLCTPGTSAIIISFDCLSEAIRFFSKKQLKINHKQKNLIHELVDIASKTYDIEFYNSDVEFMKLLPYPTLGGEQLIKNYTETLLIDIMRSITEKDSGNTVFLQESESQNKLAEDVIKILKENIYGKLTINQISSKINYSKAYIFRQFKTSMRMTIMDYFISLKIKTAKELLSHGNFSIKEISDKLSFDTPNYFSKTFKKLVGITPSQYKKRITD